MSKSIGFGNMEVIDNKPMIKLENKEWFWETVLDKVPYKSKKSTKVKLTIER